jgi:hypothetical protein
MLRSKALSIAIVLAATGVNANPTLPTFGAQLSGFHETPSIFTSSTGTFEGAADTNAQSISFTLTYSGLSAPVLFAHIHFGEKHVAGAIVAFLCGGGGKPACPQEGTVTGNVAAGDVIGVDPQGVPAGSFDALLAAIVSGSAYVNVHSTAHPAGEIRGQIKF